MTDNKKPALIKSISGKMFVQTSIMLIFYSLALVLILQFFNQSFQNSRARSWLVQRANEVDSALTQYDENTYLDAYAVLSEELSRIAAYSSCQIYIFTFDEQGETQGFAGTGSFSFLESMEYEGGGDAQSGYFLIKRTSDARYISYTRIHGEYVVELLENQTYFVITAQTTMSLARSVMVLGFLISLIWTFWYSRFFTMPIKQMNKVTLGVSRLDFSARCRVDSTDEMGGLAKNINRMSDTLRQALADLDEKNSSLQHELNRAHQVEQMRKKFVSDVSHELKTPLSIIQGYAEALGNALNREGQAEKKERYLQIISDETSKMNALVLDLLDLSQYESGYYVLNKGVFTVMELVSSVVQGFERILEKEQIELVLDVENAKLNADMRRLTQVLRNLLQNAVSHIALERKITIMGMVVGDGKYRLSVKNSGENIADEYLPRIWDSFFRADDSRNRQKGRHGIGLSIVKALVELHGGTVGVRNLDGAVEFFFII